MSRREPQRVYWDSAAFIAYLKAEPGREDKCAAVLDAGERGEVLICTSALTLTEVVRGKNLPAMTEDSSAQVRRMFAQPFIEVFGLDRIIAERARELCWKCGVKLHGNDAIHAVTALEAEVSEFHSFNGKLQRILAIKSNLPFEVCEPRARHQVLPFAPVKLPTQGRENIDRT